MIEINIFRDICTIIGLKSSPVVTQQHVIEDQEVCVHSSQRELHNCCLKMTT